MRQILSENIASDKKKDEVHHSHHNYLWSRNELTDNDQFQTNLSNWLAWNLVLENVAQYSLSLADSTVLFKNPIIAKWNTIGTLVRAEYFTLFLRIKNVGSNVFPGGSISKLDSVQYGSSFSAYSTVNSFLDMINTSLPSLPPLQTWEVSLVTAMAIEGPTWINTVVQSNDGLQVNFEGSPVGALTFQVVNRELILVLDKIDTLLNRGPPI